LTSLATNSTMKLHPVLLACDHECIPYPRTGEELKQDSKLVTIMF
jgi:hypothetical protein